MVFPWNGEGCVSQEQQNKKVARRLLGKTFLFVSSIQLAASAKIAGGVNGRRRDEEQQRMVIMKDLIKINQIRRKNGRKKQMVGF